MLSNGLSESLNNSYKGSILHITPGASASNSIRVSENVAEFGLTHSNIAFEASKGIGAFDKSMDNLASIASFYPSPCQMVVVSELEIATFQEIIDKKVKLRMSIGSSGGSSEEAFLRIIASYGITKNDMEEWGCTFTNKGMDDSSKMFSDGLLNSIFITASAPAPIITENAINKKINLVEFDQININSLCEKHGYNIIEIAGNTYDFRDTPITSFAANTILATSTDIPDEIVYKMTRAIHENLDYLKSIHAALKPMTEESILENLGVPLHPGAEMYYKEAGIIK
jgi:TRAP transporter TAXI family solute receptor